MKLTRRLVPLTLSLSVLMICAAHAQAQRCGKGFAKIIVSDTRDNIIPDVKIELVAEFPAAEYRRLWDLWNDFNSYRLTTQAAEEIIKRWGQMEFTTDLCQNPLRESSKTPRRKNSLQTTQDLGFCTSEVLTERFYVLKITAPGYITAYYAGYFLGGCNRTHRFVLTDKPIIGAS